MTYQHVTGSPTSAQSQNSFSEDCYTLKLLCFLCMHLSPLHWHRWAGKRKAWRETGLSPDTGTLSLTLSALGASLGS